MTPRMTPSEGLSTVRASKAIPNAQTKNPAPLASYKIGDRYEVALVQDGGEAETKVMTCLRDLAFSRELARFALSGPSGCVTLPTTLDYSGVSHKIEVLRGQEEFSVAITKAGTAAFLGRWSPIFIGKRPEDILVTFRKIGDGTLQVQIRDIDRGSLMCDALRLPRA